jgi:regulator of sigma D
MSGEEAKPKPNGDALAVQMLDTLIALQVQMQANAKLASEFCEKMDDLIGHFEVVGLTMEILAAMKDKQKLDLKDLARAYIEANEEIFGEEEEDVDDPGDPLVDIRR